MARWCIVVLLVALATTAGHVSSARNMPRGEGLGDQKNAVTYGGVGGYSGIGNNGLPIGGVFGGVGSGADIGGVGGYGGIGGGVGTGLGGGGGLTGGFVPIGGGSTGGLGSFGGGVPGVGTGVLPFP